jgi:sulfide:quinone oxidoreductase
MPEQSTRPRVLIAGGGIAALETMIALRKLAEDRVTLELLSAESTLVYKPAAVTEPFAPGQTPRFDLETIAGLLGVTLQHGVLAEVDLASNAAVTSDGRRLDFDVLVVAVGASPRELLPGALTFTGAAGAAAMRGLLEELKKGSARRVAFALPGGVSWSLPLYELALLTARYVAEHDLPDVELTLVTPEDAPLTLFGARASEAVARLLDDNGVHWMHGHPAAVEESRLRLVPAAYLDVDRVVALPGAAGPSIGGLPYNKDGFLEVNSHGRVWGAGRDIYAAGDATAFPIKQGGLATQQADAVAQSIAARAGASVRPQPFTPILRGKLVTGSTPRFMRHVIAGGHGETSGFNESSLWWPPSKIAGRYASAFLAGEGAAAQEPPNGDAVVDVEVPLDAERRVGDEGAQYAPTA